MKIICVPKDSIAEKRLEYDLAESDELIELNFEDESFYKLWNTGFFNSINKMIGIIIDDFEDEHISNITEIKKVIDSDIFSNYSLDKKLDIITEKIKSLFEEAYKRKTSIRFFF
ncbi:hypothetical protein [Mucilaginibacter sp. L196]|uniref:hypothetical protein n=1 Tax=Mucilaginibacter sp. L196 TaxID=1641870 RepID=UPI00131AFE66|nr:hypothetical protein [Mucilaginibacter sp. L196]